MDQGLMNKVAGWISRRRLSSLGDEGDIAVANVANQSPPNLLLSLIHPYVTNVLLDYLDNASLLSLRLVCKTTKSWVDDDRYISHLKITLHSSAGSKKMRKVMRSKTDFSNFCIGCEKRNNEDLLSEFSTRFGPTLKVLDLNTMTNHGILKILLSNCHSLESLTLLGTNLLNVGSEELEQLTKFSTALSKLQFLSIGNILFLNTGEMEYFKAFLGHCSGSLKTLRLPYINFQSKRSKEMKDKVLGSYVIGPVSHLLQNNPGGLKTLILEYLNPLSPVLFFKIANVCRANGTILHNVHESHLKRLESEQATSIHGIIGTLDGLNEKFSLSKLVQLRSISIWVSSALQLNQTHNLENPKLPKLSSISLYVDTAEEDQRINRLISTFLGVSRPQVTSLKISYNSRKGISAELVRAVDISSNFQFLQKLDIYQWEAFDEEFLTLWSAVGAYRIRELSLLLCTNLSDRGLIGPHPKHPAILALSGLKELHISSLYGSITDATLFKACRHMGLERLRIYSQSITYDGIASLLDGAFYKTIEHIHCSKPLDCTQKEFYYLVKDIINAKNFADIGKRRHLRRRSQPLMLFSNLGSGDEEEQGPNN